MPEQRMWLLVERALQLPESGLDQFEFLDGADPLVANGGVCRLPADAQSE